MKKPVSDVLEKAELSKVIALENIFLETHVGVEWWNHKKHEIGGLIEFDDKKELLKHNDNAIKTQEMIDVNVHKNSDNNNDDDSDNNDTENNNQKQQTHQKKEKSDDENED